MPDEALRVCPAPGFSLGIPALINSGLPTIRERVFYLAGSTVHNERQFVFEMLREGPHPLTGKSTHP